MTDLTKHWLEPVAWLYKKPAHTSVLRTYADPHLRVDGFTETALYSADQMAMLVEQIERLEVALMQHNDILRSAASVASRDGKDTNWLSFRGQVHYTLAEFHEIVSEVAARAALKENSDAE